MILLTLEPELVAIITFTDSLNTDDSFPLSVKIGHNLGNLHRPIKVTKNQVIFPIQAETELEMLKKMFSSFNKFLDIKTDMMIFEPDEDLISMNTKISKKMDNTDNNSKIYDGSPSTPSTAETEVSSLVEEISMLQLGDSFFPTGMYTTSSGLETLFYDKRIRSRKEIFEFITVCLTYQIGPADCAALSNAYEFAKEGNLTKIIEINQMSIFNEIDKRDSRCFYKIWNSTFELFIEFYPK